MITIFTDQHVFVTSGKDYREHIDKMERIIMKLVDKGIGFHVDSPFENIEKAEEWNIHLDDPTMPYVIFYKVKVDKRTIWGQLVNSGFIMPPVRGIKAQKQWAETLAGLQKECKFVEC